MGSPPLQHESETMSDRTLTTPEIYAAMAYWGQQLLFQANAGDTEQGRALVARAVGRLVYLEGLFDKASNNIVAVK